MSAESTVEGIIDLHLKTGQNRVQQVHIESSRPPVGELFKGQSFDSAMELIGCLYHICHRAHRLALMENLDQAGIVTLSQNERKAYSLLVDLETIREHCFAMFSRWQEGRHKRGNPGMLFDTVKRIESALFPDSDPFSLEAKEIANFGDVKPLLDRLRDVVLELIADKTMPPVDRDTEAFQRWIEGSSSLAADFFRTLCARRYSALGAVESAVLPDIDQASLHTMFEDSEFLRQPHYHQRTCETTPLVRQSGHALVSEFFALWGKSVLTRCLARFVEVFVLLDKIRTQYTGILAQTIRYNRKQASCNQVLSQVEAARGRLMHQLIVDKGRIASYRILAPTEWNFHPRGLVSRMLLELKARDQESLSQQVRLLVDAVDPCVGYRLRIEHA